MNIPDKAVEAVAYQRAQRDHDKFARRRIEEQEPFWEQISQDARNWKAKSYMDEAREDLQVAAPFIAAQALRDAADDIGGQPGRGEYYQGMDAAAASLHDRADDLEAGK